MQCVYKTKIFPFPNPLTIESILFPRPSTLALSLTLPTLQSFMSTISCACCCCWTFKTSSPFSQKKSLPFPHHLMPELLNILLHRISASNLYPLRRLLWCHHIFHPKTQPLYNFPALIPSMIPHGVHWPPYPHDTAERVENQGLCFGEHSHNLHK